MARLQSNGRRAEERKGRLLNNDAPLGDRARALARNLHVLTVMFPDSEKPLLGMQLRNAAIELVTEAVVASATDDPAEKQEMLRLAAVNCTRIRELIQLARELDHLPEDDVAELITAVEVINATIARERRTARY